MESGFRYEANPRELHKYFGSNFRWLWPEEDESLAGDMPTLVDVDTHVMPFVPNDRRNVVIQAGGAVGVWAKRFAQLFDEVYTFEPNPSSFHCLTMNAPDLNVHKYNAALGDGPGMVHMAFPEHVARSATGKENIGGYRCFAGGNIPTMTIDSLELPVVDLLFLDLEGYEMMAVRGAINTIIRCKPIVVLEDKLGCCKQFGYNPGDIERNLLHPHGYKTASRFHGGRDVVVVPK